MFQLRYQNGIYSVFSKLILSGDAECGHSNSPADCVLAPHSAVSVMFHTRTATDLYLKKKWNFVFLLWILQFILHILEVQKITDRSAV